MNYSSKNNIKYFIPPVLIDAYRYLRGTDIRFSGVYGSWDEAMAHASGYDSEIIVEKVKDALLKVQRGEAVYERDSVVFHRSEYPFPLLAALLRSALVNGGELNVLDYGGSLGSTYFHLRKFLPEIKLLRWNIVEQSIFVRYGKRFFENDELNFFDNFDLCIKDNRPDIVILSGVLQYIEDPYGLLDKIANLDIRSIVIDRTPFSDANSDILTIEIVPSSIYQASYPFWIFNDKILLAQLRRNYNYIAEFPAIDGMMKHANLTIYFKGHIFESKLFSK